ncbi:MAG: hypothetical protein IPJ81_10680 [Chitinophagaceae bacterium]|nr:hypothetical protein [Chitinophagaceae bacterium]
MVSIFFKWFLMAGLASNAFFSPPDKGHNVHPFYISVTEIEHDVNQKSLEISCKIFTDDFEKTLRQNCKCPVDILHPKDKAAMDKLVSDYIQKNLFFKINNKSVSLSYVGYEQIEEAIYSYWQVNNIAEVNKMIVVNNILYDYRKEQVNIVHVTVKGNRKSSKLNYPDNTISFEF